MAAVCRCSSALPMQVENMTRGGEMAASAAHEGVVGVCRVACDAVPPASADATSAAGATRRRFRELPLGVLTSVAAS